MGYEYYGLLEFRSAIVDELGDVVFWCDDLKKDEVESILASHPEWKNRTLRYTELGGQLYDNGWSN